VRATQNIIRNINIKTITRATGERKTEHKRTIKNGLQSHFQKGQQNLPQNYLQYKNGFSFQNNNTVGQTTRQQELSVSSCILWHKILIFHTPVP
jgi:hypothetical protein